MQKAAGRDAKASTVCYGAPPNCNFHIWPTNLNFNLKLRFVEMRVETFVETRPARL